MEWCLFYFCCQAHLNIVFSLAFSFWMQPLLIAGITAKILPLPASHRLIYMQRFVAAKFPAANRAYYHQPIYTVIHFIFTASFFFVGIYVNHTNNSVSKPKYKGAPKQIMPQKVNLSPALTLHFLLMSPPKPRVTSP